MAKTRTVTASPRADRVRKLARVNRALSHVQDALGRLGGEAPSGMWEDIERMRRRLETLARGR